MRSLASLLESEGKRPVLVHGTSVEAVIEMLSTGYLPSSYTPGASGHPADNGYLFFVPRREAFARHPLYEKLRDCDSVEETESEVSFYAWNRQMSEFLQKTFEGWPRTMNPLYPPLSGGMNDTIEHDEDSYRAYADAGLDFSELAGYGLERLSKELLALKGVVIGLNEKVFELRLEQGCDEPVHEVMIHLPGGLSLEYVEYIKPLGEYEKRALAEFFDALEE